MLTFRATLTHACHHTRTHLHAQSPAYQQLASHMGAVLSGRPGDDAGRRAGQPLPLHQKAVRRAAHLPRHDVRVTQRQPLYAPRLPQQGMVRSCLLCRGRVSSAAVAARHIDAARRAAAYQSAQMARAAMPSSRCRTTCWCWTSRSCMRQRRRT